MLGLSCSYDLHIVETTLEGIEPLHPHLPVGIEPGIQLDQWLETHPIHPPLGIGPHRDETRCSQHSQMLRDSRLGYPECRDEVADRSLSIAEELQDSTSVGIAEDLESRHSGAYDSSYITKPICTTLYQNPTSHHTLNHLQPTSPSHMPDAKGRQHLAGSLLRCTWHS